MGVRERGIGEMKVAHVMALRKNQFGDGGSLCMSIYLSLSASLSVYISIYLSFLSAASHAGDCINTRVCSSSLSEA